MKDEKYCIYLRKSREDKELEKYDGVDTLYRHRKTLTNFANANNMEIKKIYEEVVSAETIEDRPVMKQLLGDIEENMWSGVLVMEVQRLARGDTADQGIVAKTFKYSGTKIITPTKTYDPNNEDDEEYFEFGLFMSRREYKAINKRLQRGRLASINEGKYVGSVPPYGYKRKKLENSKGYTLDIEIAEAEVVKQIFNIYAYQEISLNGVVKIVNDLGLKPRKAEYWNIASIKDLLNNQVYIGKIRWNSRKQVISMKNGSRVKHRPRSSNVILIDGLHPSIIDNTTWAIVQNKRKCNTTPPVVNMYQVQNPLVGLVYCEKCGKLMQRRPYTSKSKEPTLICNNPKCDNISSKLHIVEEKIIEALKIWLKSYTIDYDNLLEMKQNARITTDEDVLKSLRTKLNKEKIKQGKIYDLFEEGVYDKEEFSSRLLNSKFNIKELEDKIKQIEDRLKVQNDAINERKIAVHKIENVIDLYDKLKTNEQKNALLKTILVKVTYLKTEKAIRKNSNPNNFEIHIYPRVPKR